MLRKRSVKQQNREATESAKRGMREANSSSPTTSPATSHVRKFSFGRFGSLRRKSSKKDTGKDSTTRLRPDSDMSHRNRSHKSKSSVSSSSSYVAMKVRMIDVLTPHPKIRFDHQINPFGPTLSRSNSRSNTEFRRDLRDFTNRSTNKRYVESIADEMDARAIREAMERDKRRREAKKDKKSSKKRGKSSERSRAQIELEETLLRTRAAIATASQSDLRGQYGYLAEHIPAGPSSYNRDARQIDARQDDGVQTPLTWLRDPSSEDLRAIGVAEGSPEWREDPRQALGYSDFVPGHRREASDETYASDQTGEIHQPFGTFNGAWTEYPIEEEPPHVADVEQGQSALLSDSEGEDERRQSANLATTGLAISYDREEHTHYRSYSSDEESRLRAGRGSDDEADDDYGFNEEDFQHYSNQAPSQEQSHFDDYASASLSRSSSRSSDHRVGYLSPLADAYDEAYATHSSHQFTPRFSGYHTASSVAYHPRESIDQHSGFSRPVSNQRSGAASPDDKFGTQSLASIDSEGSWFGASRAKRASQATGRSSFNHAASPLRTSSASITPQLSGFEGFEGRSSPSKADSPYLGRYSSLSEQSYDEGARTRMELSDVEDEDEIGENVYEGETGQMRDSAGRTAVLHQAPRERSRIGLLHEFDDEAGTSKHVSYNSQTLAYGRTVSPVSPISGDSRAQSPASFNPDESFRFL